jgi:hypothetical protein
MRCAAVGLSALWLLVASTAAAGTVDPRSLVIRSADVPTGYQLDRSESGLRTNPIEAKENSELAPLFRKWGRVTGYQSIFERGESTIEARTDLFRAATGAGRMLAWSEQQARLAGVQGLRGAHVRVGQDGWIFWTTAQWTETYVYWRFKRAWSVVGGRGVARGQALALARLQQQRIAAALR